MIEEHLSGSSTQRKIEKIVVEGLSNKFGCVFERKAKNASFEFDFYNEEKKIMGEIYSGTTKINPGSKKKVIADCFKLVAAEKMFGGTWNKYVVFVDENIKKSFEGKSWIHQAIELFEIELLIAPLSAEHKIKLQEAKIRQQKGNVMKSSD